MELESLKGKYQVELLRKTSYFLLHIGELSYKCVECSSSFRQHSHLSRHMNVHIKTKSYTCLPGLAQHQETHTGKKAYECTNSGKYFGQKTNIALHEKMHTSATQDQYTHCMKCFRQPSHLTVSEKGHKDDSEHCSDCRENLLLFSKFKPVICPECVMNFVCISDLISHHIHKGEKSHKTCGKSFILDSQLAFHQKSHKPFKCSVCGKSFRLNMNFVIHQQTHSKNVM
ncbi:LOW QUALITY PROTEIN: zinc finger protein 597 [Hipposideros larvatus]